MKLYLISQTENNDYDTFNAAVVCADSVAEAVALHPNGENAWKDKYNSTWCKSPDNVNVEFIGNAVPGSKKGFILRSFQAG